MSYATISQAASDEALANRVIAGVHKESQSNPTFGDTVFGAQVEAGTASIWMRFSFPVAIATELPYEYAVNTGNPNPGGDPTVITDADILAAVQANWPPDPPAAP